MTDLMLLKDSMQKFAEVTKAALKLDIDLFDHEGYRVAGTGVSKDKVGKAIATDGIVNRHIFKGEAFIVIDHPGVEENCATCIHYGDCVYQKAVYAAIRSEGQTIGAMGILAFNEAQARLLTESKREMLDFSQMIAELISTRVKDFTINRALKNEISGGLNPIGLSDIVGRSQAMRTFKERVRKVAQSRSTLLLHGETGTGKELFARGVHAESPWRRGPFIVINCGAIPENLIESELFGYESGSFTGASKYGKLGKLQSADQGTVFLDEVENMPLYMQQKLLRFLETREIERIGATDAIRVDLRVIVASNQDLETMVRLGTFREDLFHRINVITLDIPPLRERGQDTTLLAEHFLEKYRTYLKREIDGFAPEVLALFRTYPWPGNVRELQNAVEYAVNMTQGGTIGLSVIPERIRKGDKGEHTLALMEKKAIEEALKRFGWSDEDKAKAAEHLGISRSTIYRKIKHYGIAPS